jgi:hypothetical protein
VLQARGQRQDTGTLDRFFMAAIRQNCMNGRACLVPLACLVLLLAAAGCSTLSVGDVSYGNGNLTVAVTGTGSPETIGVQVRVFTLEDFGQHELLSTGTTTQLTGKENTIDLPLSLSPGRYKLYVYLVRDGERETAVIRDITV